jgi:hypothetical protein
MPQTIDQRMGDSGSISNPRERMQLLGFFLEISLMAP